MSEFYIGYLPKAPESVRRAVRPVVFAMCGGVIALALLLVFGQQPFASSTFEFLQYRDYTGRIVDAPSPTLLTSNGPFLLVAPGKHGAGELIRGYNRQSVQLRGSLIRRDADRMIEVLPGSIHSTNAPAPPEQVTDLGAVTLSGEIVDSKCHFGVMNPGNGKVHRDCAARCLSGGISPAFLVKDASGEPRSLLLADVHSREIIDFVAEPVRIQGWLRRSAGTLILAVERPGNKPAIARH